MKAIIIMMSIILAACGKEKNNVVEHKVFEIYNQKDFLEAVNYNGPRTIVFKKPGIYNQHKALENTRIIIYDNQSDVSDVMDEFYRLNLNDNPYTKADALNPTDNPKPNKE